MAAGDLTNKLEAAALALLGANPITGLVGFSGQDASTHSRPALICKAEQGDEFPQGSGNFNMQLTLEVQTSADDNTLAEHRSFFASTVALFTDSTVASGLSGLADFHVIGVFNPRFSSDVQERAYISQLILTVYCCATDIGA